MINLEQALETMEAAATRAGHMLLYMQPRTQRLAASKDFLIDADLKSEKIILDILKAQYPDIPSFSEESGGKKLMEGYLWVVDPIDGTINFFLQDDHWGISIGLVENGHTVAGIIYLPSKKMLFVASRYHIAKLRRINEKESHWTDLSVNQQSNLGESQFWVGWGKEEHEGKDHKKVYDAIEKLDRHTLYPQIRNSCIADMMMVALGKITGYVFPKPEPFDIAAGALIVERAGGTVTDFEGKAWSPFSGSLVASNGILHKDLLRLLNG